MKVGYVSGSISRNAGGLFFSVRSLSQTVNALAGFESRVFSLEDAHSAEDVVKWQPLRPNVHKVVGPGALGYSPSLQSDLVASECDVLHTQGIWQGCSHAVNHWHDKMNKPYLVAPRGMLDPWALANARWKKKVAGLLYENKHLQNAACLHALCRSEAESMRAYGLKNPICVIPNGIHLPEIGAGAEKEQSGLKTLVFIGRIHPKKGLVHALEAWSQLARDGWKFVIAGWDQGGHEQELKDLLTKAGVPWVDRRDDSTRTASEGGVEFYGSTYGDEKKALLRVADAFILPSYSEGLPMAVLEAWSYGLPVVMTEFCNIPEGFEAEAAIEIGTDKESILAGLEQLVSLPEAAVQEIGERGLQLVKDKFTWEQISKQMAEVYQWVAGETAQPEIIEL
ncbi:glycosyltransferase [Rubritalea spongiae]|uniref:Glycosyltransferase n=1 Tax=Rubritalea spongiae TaxID=430797 RepID=A0ABW5E1H3_9BACT